jgi:cyanophycin synthetase
MEFRKIRALRGPNIWANSPVIEAWIDLKERKDTSSAMIPGFTDRLMAMLPGLIEHECSEGHRGGFLIRLQEGTYPAHILEHVALELQDQAGTPVGYGRARETAEEGVYRVVIKYREEAVGRACIEAARELILAAMEDRPFEVQGVIEELRGLVHEVALGPNTAAMIEAARTMGIPHRRVGPNSLVVLGYGSKQRRIYASTTDEIGFIANAISCDKDLTKSLLLAAGVPVPEGRPVGDADEAWEAAVELGTPVVVKPRDSDYGLGVTLNLTTREQVRAAYDHARKVSQEILVERHIPGSVYRLLMINGRLIAAVRRDPALVVGNGRSTIAELVELANADPRRGDNPPFPIRKMRLDEPALEALAGQGYTPASVPPAGTRVLIQLKPHLLTGGTNADVTNEVHPEVAACAARAARIIDLEIAGLDLVARDITKPLEEQGGVVLEVNAGPGIRPHLEPDEGESRPVAREILETLFRPGESGRIPVVAVTGVNGKTTVTRLIAHLLHGTGVCVGMTCTDGIFIADRRIATGDCGGPRSARDVLLNPEVEAAVLETGRGGILREGLGFDRCAVAVVTNIGEGDHLGHENVMTAEDMIKVKRTIVDVVLTDGWAVLNAADPLVAGMAEYCRGGVIYFAPDADHSLIGKHQGKGGRVVFVRNGMIVLAEGSTEEALAALDRVALTRGGRIGFQVENVLAAVAAAWALGLPSSAISAGLESFDSTPRLTPGRFNVLDAGDATVIVDSGHNASALEAVVRSLTAFEGRRRTAVVSADGDRRDDVIVRQAEILAPHFDNFVLYEESRRNCGRAPGAISALLRRGLSLGSTAQPHEVVEVFGEQAAITQALGGLEPGDLQLILVDAVETSLALVQNLLSGRDGVAGR